jgi:hypothetical protein
MREPKGFKSAAKHLGWIAAMDAEIQALHHNHAWDLVPRSPNQNVVGSKWIFHIKYLLMVLWIVLRLVLSQRATRTNWALTSSIHLALLSRLPLLELFCP